LRALFLSTVTAVLVSLSSSSPVSAQIRSKASRSGGGSGGHAAVTVVTVLVIVGLLIIAAVLAIFLVKRGNVKYAKLWPGLTGIVGGTFKGHKMSGTYQNLPVNAQVKVVAGKRSRGLGRGTRSAKINEYSFEISSVAGSQGGDWVVWDDITPGGGQWRTRADDDLARRLKESGIVAEVQRESQGAEAHYKAGSGTLTYSTRIADAYALPNPQQFQIQLDTLMRLAQLNRQINVA
jgi:hypothetical protein